MTRPEPGSADDQTPLPSEAPTLVPSAPPDEEARTIAADLHGSPQSTVAGALDPTRDTDPARTQGTHRTAGRAAPGTAPFANTGSQSGATRTASGTGTFTRTLRTRINFNLPAEAQQLDEKLQLSRPSVLVDMSSARGDVLPPGLRKLVDAQGTEGRYAIQKPLAAGGMGAVLAIHDNDFRRDAAMKVILGRHANSPEAVERFLAEAQVTAQLEHPNIVPIHDLGVMDDGTLYFTMKLIEGLSLGSVIKALRLGEDRELLATWTLDHKLYTFLKILDGIGFAHSRGVVHRDIKPDNIMLGAHGEVLVVDWGIAKVLGETETAEELAAAQRRVVSLRDEESAAQTLTGAAMGTIFYMPPEQAAGRLDEVDARADIYALGASLYNLLSLKRPLEPAPPAEMIARTVTGDLIPLEQQIAGLPSDLLAIVRKSMNVARDLRYPSCAAFADDLRRFLAGQAVIARHRNLIERIGAWIAAHRRQVQLGVAAAALVAVAAATAVWFERAASRRTLARLNDIAQREIAAAGPELDGAHLELAWTAINGAAIIAPGDAQIADLRQKIGAARILSDEARRQAERRRAAADQATTLAAEAERQRAAGDLEAADQAILAAFKLAPDDDTIIAARDAIQRLLHDKRQRDAAAKAEQFKTAGAQALAQARGLPLTSAELPQHLTDAHDAFVAAGKQGVAAPNGLDALMFEAAALAQRAEDARNAAAQQQTDQRAHDEGVADAQRLADAGEWGKAREAIAAALKRKPDSEPAIALRDRIVAGEHDAETARTREQRLAGARVEAEAALARARAGLKDLVAGDERQVRLDAEVTRLERSNGDDARRITTRGEAYENRRAMAERWALTEGDAQSALGLLGEEPAHPLAAEARRLLADLYHRRLDEATALRVPAEILAFTNLLTRYDTEGRYLRDLGENGTLIVQSATPTKLALRRVERGADTRLAPVGESTAIATSVDSIPLKKGRWQLSDGVSEVTVVIEPGREALIAWPDQLPTLNEPKIALRYVPRHGTTKAFMLGATEITHDQYLPFVKDPTIWPGVLKALEQARAGTRTDALPFVPRTAPTTGVIWQLYQDQASGAYADVALDAYSIGRPVNGITRDDAEAYCAWLSRKSGLKVRLPTLDEWRFAADGGDRERVWPWGEIFDQAFAVTASTAGEQTALVAAPTGDIGPFGHRGLAGNVRELVADRVREGDRERTLIAGGSFADRSPAQFRCDATELIQTDAVFTAFGFRILVELP